MAKTPNTAVGAFNEDQDLQLLWVQILPVRCEFQGPHGIVTNSTQSMICNDKRINSTRPNFKNYVNTCNLWNNTYNGGIDVISKHLNIRPASIRIYSDTTRSPTGTLFNTTTMINHHHTIAFVNQSSVLLQLTMLFTILFLLSILRGDSSRLVIHPLRRMLKIVLRCKPFYLNIFITSNK